MSLILEALKKSEQQRRLGEAPTFGTPAPLARRRRTLLPLLALMIVAVLGIGWWLRHTPPAANDATPPRPAAPVAAATPPVDATRQTPAQTPAKSNPKPAATKPATTKPATQPPVAPPVLPMPTTDRPGSVAPLPAMPVATAPVAAPGEAVASGAGAPHPAGPAVAGPAAPTTAAPTPPSGAPPTKPAEASAVPESKPIAPKRPAPAAPVLPTVWDLPYSTRKDIPELALTMHVYSDQATDRFVVIKGERHVEGDDLGEGVMLREITPDGMVLEFKGQRFVYPRAGR